MNLTHLVYKWIIAGKVGIQMDYSKESELFLRFLTCYTICRLHPKLSSMKGHTGLYKPNKSQTETNAFLSYLLFWIISSDCLSGHATHPSDTTNVCVYIYSCQCGLFSVDSCIWWAANTHLHRLKETDEWHTEKLVTFLQRDSTRTEYSFKTDYSAWSSCQQSMAKSDLHSFSH